jgi:hypothetical protein
VVRHARESHRAEEDRSGIDAAVDRLHDIAVHETSLLADLREAL